ncbi:hypothetical protein GCM10023339_35810 [Alloalcanivorax gelatiniphagus]
MWDMRMEKDNASSLDRVLDILLLFAGHGQVVKRTEIERRFGLSRSSAYRYLHTLRRRGLITGMARSGEYVLSPGFARLVALTEENGRDMCALVRPILRELAGMTGETALVTHRVGERVLCVGCQEGPRVVRVGLAPALETPLYVGSSAKVHLAHMPDYDIRRVLDHCATLSPEQWSGNVERLEQELVEIRERGYATSVGELEEGVFSTSVPVFCHDGSLLAAVTVAAVGDRAENPEDGLLDHLRIAAARIAREWPRSQHQARQAG